MFAMSSINFLQEKAGFGDSNFVNFVNLVV
jgi:hypothetical protein